MAIQTLNTIKNWFKTGLKPSQQQFWDTWDSFRHKFEKVPVKDVEGIDELLTSKADKTALDNHLADKIAHAPQVNTDWNSESGFSQLINKPEFKTINGEEIVGDGDIIVSGGGGNQDLQSVVDLGGRVSKESFTFLDILEGSTHDRHIWGSVHNGNDLGSTFAIWNDQSYLTNNLRNVGGQVGVYQGKAQMTRTRSGGGSSNSVILEFDAVNPTYDSTVLIPVPKTWGTYRLTLADDFKTINGESIVGEGDITIGATTTDATTTVKGSVKLTGDLGGTADNPTTPTALHKTGNESWSGQKSFNSSETILSTFSGIQNRSNSDLVRLDTGFNNAGGTLLNIQSAGGNSSNNTAKLLVLNSGELSVGMPFTVSKAGVVKATVDKEGNLITTGNVTGNSFVKTGGLGTQFLKADGSVDSSIASGTFTPTTGGAYVTFARSYWTLVGKVLTVHLNGSVTGVTGVAFNVILPNSFSINSPIVNRRIGAGIVQLPSASLTLGNMYFREDTINTIVGVEIITPNNNTYNFSGSFLVLIN